MGFLETSFVDWPGRVAAVVFLPRCNYRCPYCHNHPVVLAPESLVSWDPEGVLGRVGELREWLDGVCVTGGEPTLHRELPALLAGLRARGLPVKLDTNGSRPEVLEALLARGLLDAVALDVKAPLEPLPYRRNGGPGAEPDAVRRSLALLAGAEVDLEVRTTVHPALLSRAELGRLAETAGALLAGPRRGATRFTVQRCRAEETLDPGLKDRPGLPPDAFDAWAREAREAFWGARGRLDEGAARAVAG